MRLNWATALVGARVTLRPYRACHVRRYHGWMSDAALREATASDELTLGEELANQRSWLDDEAKLTFIVCATTAAGAALPADATAGMCGDANLFFLKPEHTAEYAAAAGAGAGAVVAEVMVMIADGGMRRRGLAGEAVCALLRYGMERCGVAAAVCSLRRVASATALRRAAASSGGAAGAGVGAGAGAGAASPCPTGSGRRSSGSGCGAVCAAGKSSSSSSSSPTTTLASKAGKMSRRIWPE